MPSRRETKELPKRAHIIGKKCGYHLTRQRGTSFTPETNNPDLSSFTFGFFGGRWLVRRHIRPVIRRKHNWVFDLVEVAHMLTVLVEFLVIS